MGARFPREAKAGQGSWLRSIRIAASTRPTRAIAESSNIFDRWKSRLPMCALGWRKYSRARRRSRSSRVAKFLADETAKPVRPTPPLGQPLGQVKDPLYGLGTHPDIVEQLWRLDSGLPASCRWVVWGYPALAHPLSGVIFAVGFGTIGIAMRLPAGFRDAAPTAPGAVTGRRTSRPQDPNGACSAAVPKPRPAAPPSILPPRQPPSRPHVASAPQRQFTVTLKSTGPDRTKR